ncbi:hypothetical protein [Lactococcus lactis]|uniref:hypothetical protein n=1 Tax=Lactococcus lactis TaxID=1358 RepID=UPI0019115AE4|nr:hypothetical protein [Lactococcus lactis]WDA70084.1 hypothetical protein IL310_08595 [Lactococcus lactis]
MGPLLQNCKVNFKSGPLGKIPTDTVAWFFKIRNPNLCNIFGFKNSTAENASILYSHNYADKPDTRICGLEKCDMSGTLFVTPKTAATGEDPIVTTVTTEIKANGENFQFGYLRVFIDGKAGDKFGLSVMNMTGEGANKYSVTLAQTGWNAVVIELFNPKETVSGGWIGENGSIKLVVTPGQQTAFELSTVELFEDIYDMVKDQTFGFTCISDFSGDPALTITEDLCAIPGYDETATKIERSLTATNIIGELADFHNMTRRLKDSEHYMQTRGKFTAKSETVNGTEYATFIIPELADNLCPRLVVQPQNCEFDTLYHVDIDKDMTTIELPEEQFFLKGNKVFMSKTYVNTDIIVSYPIVVEGTAWDITSDDLNDQHYQMEMVTPINGDEYLIKADNVMLTALPFTWTNAAGTFTVPFTMAKDDQGKFGRIVKVDHRK